MSGKECTIHKLPCFLCSTAQIRNRAYTRNKESMKNTMFVVRLSRSGLSAPRYVQRVDRAPIQTTSNRKQALMMGRLTAEDVAKAMHTSQCKAELVSVAVRG